MLNLTQSRRHFLATQTMGVGSLALAWLLRQDGLLAAPAKPSLEREIFDLTPKQPHNEPTAKAMISLFMHGGPSQVDLFDRKLELEKHNGQAYAGEIKYDNDAEASTKLLASPWKFVRHGQCGMELSELLPHTGKIVDDMTLIRSMTAASNNHGPSLYAMNTGRALPGRPTLGSWITYGLGSESQNLPAYVVMTDPEKLPTNGTANWSNGYLPSIFQGTHVRSTEPRIPNLDPPAHLAGPAQRSYLGYLEKLNREHLGQHQGESDLAARIASYELAARMQVAAKEALDLSQESEATHKLYGLDNPKCADFAARCLIARRLVERGVRFVQIFTIQDRWDNHQDIVNRLPDACGRTDQPSAALVMDLKARGLLETTLVHWGGEMGRLPVIQNEKNIGRDHNTSGFSMWLAGGGVKAGLIHGATDEVGYKAVENVVNHYDYHATLLHMFGFDPQQLTFKRASTSASLVDGQPARVVKEILRKAPA